MFRSVLMPRLAGLAILTAAVGLVCPAVASAAGTQGPLVIAGIPVVGGLLHGAGSVFSSIGGAVFGAFTWTIGLATKFVLTTIAALVHLLIPQSWLHKGLQIVEWIVAVPDYGAKLSTPGGGHVYGFAGVNELRGVFGWLGLAIAPLTLVYATSRAMIGEGDPIGVPVLRTVVVGVVIVSYPYWWGQAAALVDQITSVILSVPDVSAGLYKLMAYAVGGVALSGWQLIDLALMGAVAIELLGLIFMKVVVILLGAWLYATGPLMIGLVPTREGSALARAWVTAVLGILVLGVVWASLFAVGAVLINDSTTAGPLIAGSTGLGSLFGGVLLAVAGLASLWLCLKVAREAGRLLTMQLGGLLVTGANRGTAGSGAGVGSRMQQTTGRSLREYSRRLAAAGSGAAGELALATAGTGAAGAAVVRGGRAIGQVGRRGLAGTAMAGVRSAGNVAAPAVAATFSRSRAGAVAVRMGRAGTAGWQQQASRQQRANPTRRGAQSAPVSVVGGRAPEVRQDRTSPGRETEAATAAVSPRRGRSGADANGSGSGNGIRDGRGSRAGNGGGVGVPFSSSRPVGAPRGSGSESKPAPVSMTSSRARRLGSSRPPAEAPTPSSPTRAGGGVRPTTAVGGSPTPPPPAAVQRRRFGRKPAPSTPPTAAAGSVSQFPVNVIAPEPRARRPLGAGLSRPFRSRKGGR